jgi:hypothetical protein
MELLNFLLMNGVFKFDVFICIYLLLVRSHPFYSICSKYLSIYVYWLLVTVSTFDRR